MRIPLVFVVAMTVTSSAHAADAVELTQQEGRLAITIGGRPFATFMHDGYKKPFLIDLRAPQGTVITRSLDQGAVTDHPHHKGVWIAVDRVAGLKHWNEGHAIRTKSVAILEELLETPGDPAGFVVTNEWLDDNGRPVLLETTTVTIHPDRLIAYDIKLTPAGNKPVEFADTKEGFFAIRVRDELREAGGTGQIVNANGQKGEKEAWGQKAAWVDYSGQVDGKDVGVAIFDQPDNPRPGRYHVRGYGLFAISPFGQSAYTNRELKPDPVHLKPGETLRLRYAAWIHDGNADQAGVAKRYEDFVAATSGAQSSQ